MRKLALTLAKIPNYKFIHVSQLDLLIRNLAAQVQKDSPVQVLRLTDLPEEILDWLRRQIPQVRGSVLYPAGMPDRNVE